MNRITRWYNQNKRIIWVVGLTIVAVIFLIRVLNNYYENNPKISSSTSDSTTAYNTNNYSVITDEKIGENIAIESNNLIDNFFQFCNSGQIENAYNILSNDCKEELYPTIDDFNNKYYKRIFTENRSYKSMLWITTNTKKTYRLEIMGDILATGEIDSMPIEDYYTIIEQDGEYKLNVGRYIGKEEINVLNSYNQINVQVICKKMYIDYEIYEVKVENNTGKRILFNPKQNMKSIYLQDENELKYIAFLNEITDYDLLIQNGMSKTYSMKFNRGYKPNINIEKIVFSDIVTESNEQRITIEIEV